MNLYGNNTLRTQLEGAGNIVLEQTTDYPWDGRVTIAVKELKGKKDFSLRLRLPEWCMKSLVQKNGLTITPRLENGYCVIDGTWKKGDAISFTMQMPTRIMEANPLVEENRGQVAVQRGPIVYCAESTDLSGIDIDNVSIPLDAQFRPVEMTIDGSRVMGLEGEVVVRGEASWKGQLYREVARQQQRRTIRLIPYYAWGNRGKSEMTVWMPADF